MGLCKSWAKQLSQSAEEYIRTVVIWPGTNFASLAKQAIGILIPSLRKALTLCATLLKSRDAMNNFRVHTFLFATVLIGFLLVPSFLAAFGVDEGTLEVSSPVRILVWCFYVVRFPTHTLWWNLFSSSPLLYLGGLAVNCMFWGFVVERVVWLVKSKST
jgi:hypothetical protein